MAEETDTQVEAAEEEFSAAAPPHPGAAGTGETSVGDAEAPTAGELTVKEDLDAAEQRRRVPRARAAHAGRLRELPQARRARVRAAQERGVAKLAKELLPALDNLDRALEAAEGHEDPLLEGVRSCAPSSSPRSRGSASRPSRPRASRSIPTCTRRWPSSPSEGAERGTVVEVYQPGYRLKARVIRPARVVVAA